jgi:hypothetical protein
LELLISDFGFLFQSEIRNPKSQIEEVWNFGAFVKAQNPNSALGGKGEI